MSLTSFNKARREQAAKAEKVSAKPVATIEPKLEEKLEEVTVTAEKKSTKKSTKKAK